MNYIIKEVVILNFEEKFWHYFLVTILVFVLSVAIYFIWSFAKWYVLLTCPIGVGKELYKYYTKHTDSRNLNIFKVLLLGFAFIFYPISKAVEVFTNCLIKDTKRVKTGRHKPLIKLLK